MQRPSPRMPWQSKRENQKFRVENDCRISIKEELICCKMLKLRLFFIDNYSYSSLISCIWYCLKYYINQFLKHSNFFPFSTRKNLNQLRRFNIYILFSDKSFFDNRLRYQRLSVFVHPPKPNCFFFGSHHFLSNKI